MSIPTIRQAKQSTPTQVGSNKTLSPLNSGDRLSRVEFERRYAAHPEIKKAELIEGVVYVSSPVRYQQHADPHFGIIGWLVAYCAATPGVKGGDNATLHLDFENEVQPDALLRLEPEVGGKSFVSDDDYLEGIPELIIEISASSASYDLHDKRRAYARNGVPEYLVLQTYEQRIDWFVLQEGVYETIEANESSLLCSQIFPGLWLKPTALWSGDIATMLAVLQEGLASPEHTTFVKKLGAKSQA